MGALDGPVELDDGKIGRVVSAQRRTLRDDLGAPVYVLISNRRQMGWVFEMIVEYVAIRVARRVRIDAVTSRQDQVVVDEHTRADRGGRLIYKKLIRAEPM
jgi:hypothetical protein